MAAPLKKELEDAIRDVLKAMDNSKDTSAAIREIMLSVYTLGVRRGAVDGYNVGYRDGSRKDGDNRRAVAVDRVAADAADLLRGELSTGTR